MKLFYLGRTHETLHQSILLSDPGHDATVRIARVLLIARYDKFQRWYTEKKVT